MDYNSKPTRRDLASAFNPTKTYNPETDLAPEDLQAVKPWKGSGGYADMVNEKLPLMSRLKQLLQTHLLNNNQIEPGTFEDN